MAIPNIIKDEPVKHQTRTPQDLYAEGERLFGLTPEECKKAIVGNGLFKTFSEKHWMTLLHILRDYYETKQYPHECPLCGEKTERYPIMDRMFRTKYAWKCTGDPTHFSAFIARRDMEERVKFKALPLEQQREILRCADRARAHRLRLSAIARFQPLEDNEQNSPIS